MTFLVFLAGVSFGTSLMVAVDLVTELVLDRRERPESERGER